MSDLMIVEGTNYLAPAASIQTILQAYQLKKDLIENVLKRDVDYGTIPGATKDALLKPGAEKLANFFGLGVSFVDVLTVEDWTGKDHDGEPFFYYRQKCRLSRGGNVIAEADGSCNSWEKKYRYRSGERVCPNCGKPAIIKGKAEYGGGWICFNKKGGCGAKFSDTDPAIVGQSTGQVKNPDVSEQVNTILKMAQKRAMVAAVLIGTGASDYFTQDMEDFVTEGQFEVKHEQEAEKKPEQKPAPKKPAAQKPPDPEAPVELLTLDAARSIKTPKGTELGALNAEQLETLIAANNHELTPAIKDAAKFILATAFEEQKAADDYGAEE